MQSYYNCAAKAYYFYSLYCIKSRKYHCSAFCQKNYLYIIFNLSEVYLFMSLIVLKSDILSYFISCTVQFLLIQVFLVHDISCINWYFQCGKYCNLFHTVHLFDATDGYCVTLYPFGILFQFFIVTQRLYFKDLISICY